MVSLSTYPTCVYNLHAGSIGLSTHHPSVYTLYAGSIGLSTHCPSVYTLHAGMTMTMTMTIFYSIIDIQIEIIMYNSLENPIINWSGDYYYDKLIFRYHNSHQ